MGSRWCCRIQILRRTDPATSSCPTCPSRRPTELPAPRSSSSGMPSRLARRYPPPPGICPPLCSIRAGIVWLQTNKQDIFHNRIKTVIHYCDNVTIDGFRCVVLRPLVAPGSADQIPGWCTSTTCFTVGLRASRCLYTPWSYIDVSRREITEIYTKWCRHPFVEGVACLHTLLLTPAKKVIPTISPYLTYLARPMCLPPLSAC